MENKLELKHLAPYLPYGVTCVSKKGFAWALGSGNINHALSWWKPLLIPLSELKNYPDDEYKDVKYTVATTDCIDDIPYWVWEKLVELHFDVYGLLEAGLALNKLEHGK